MAGEVLRRSLGACHRVIAEDAGEVFESLANHATGMPVLDAEADFRRARRGHALARIARRLRRQRDRGRPRTLADAAMLPGGSRRLEVVPLPCIVGTLEPTVDFDARFRPASEVVRRRWERIALAHRRGDPLPPIDLVKRGDGYYVLDGRHRVSVARAFGHRDIDAWVSGGARRHRDGTRRDTTSGGDRRRGTPERRPESAI
jgi:hypothetical protein